MASVLLGIGLGLFAVVSALLYVAGRARARALADDVRTNVEPFLRRQAAEAGLPAEPPTWTRRSAPEAIVAYSGRLASRLNERAKLGFEPKASDSMSFGKTLPDLSSDEVRVNTAKTK